MSAESYPEMLSRVRMMAEGDNTWDLSDNDVAALRGVLARLDKLETAIKLHRDQRGDDRCWLDDQVLYAALGDNEAIMLRLPPKDVFLKNCDRYWECRQDPQQKYRPEDGVLWEDSIYGETFRVVQVGMAVEFQRLKSYPGDPYELWSVEGRY